VNTDQTASGADVSEVKILASAFDPREVVIRVGQRVRWTNTDSRFHTVISNPGPDGCQPASTEYFASYELPQGMAYEHVFNVPGTFHYHCVAGGCAMSGIVTVT
jgi:plastocyanin